MTFARTHDAETQYHLANATAAWTANQPVRAGEELEMAADHLERTAKDAGVTLDRRATTALAGVRAVGGRLRQSVRVPPEEFRATATALDSQRRTVGARIAPRG